MKIIHLLLPQFHFAHITKRGMVHVFSEQNGSWTFCGKAMEPGDRMPERQIGLSQVCGRCLASVQTFERGRMYEVVES